MKKIFALAALLFPLSSVADNPPKTLLQLAGGPAEPARLSDSVLVIIDAQREYVDGALPLAGMDDALAEGSRLLARARAARTPVVHVVHHGGGALFDPDGPYFAIAQPLMPKPGEAVIEKRQPNAFAGTQLQAVLAKTGRKRLIIIGFMTHMCLNSTVRAASELGYDNTVVASATATRDVPDGQGGTIPAAVVQRASLGALGDRFAFLVDEAKGIAD